jgi:WD40 repeat protein
MANGYPRPPRVIFSAISPPGNAPSTLAASALGSTAPESAAISSFYAVVNLDATIQIFNIANPKEENLQRFLLRTFPDPQEESLKEIPNVTDIAFSPDGRFLSWGRTDGTIELYNIQEDNLTLVTRVDRRDEPSDC